MDHAAGMFAVAPLVRELADSSCGLSLKYLVQGLGVLGRGRGGNLHILLVTGVEPRRLRLRARLVPQHLERLVLANIIKL